MLKRFILAFALLGVCASVSWGQITQVGSTTCAFSSDNRTAVITDMNTTGATLLVRAHIYGQGAANTLNDSLSNSYTNLTERCISSSACVRISYTTSATPSVGSGQDFEAADSFPLSSYPVLCVAAFSGTDGTQFDNESGNIPGLAVANKPGSIDPAGTDSLFITAIAWGLGVASAPAIDNGFGGLVSDMTSTNHYAAAIAHLVHTGSAALDPEWTWSGGNDTSVSGMAVFSPSGGGGGGSQPNRMMTLGVR